MSVLASFPNILQFSNADIQLHYLGISDHAKRLHGSVHVKTFSTKFPLSLKQPIIGLAKKMLAVLYFTDANASSGCPYSSISQMPMQFFVVVVADTTPSFSPCLFCHCLQPYFCTIISTHQLQSETDCCGFLLSQLQKSNHTI